MAYMDWIAAIRQWRLLTSEEQQSIRRRNLPGKIARSMAFEGEPVERQMLEAEHARLDGQRTSKPPPAT